MQSPVSHRSYLPVLAFFAALGTAAVFVTGGYVPFLTPWVLFIDVLCMVALAAGAVFLFVRNRATFTGDRLFFALLAIPVLLALIALVNGSLFWAFFKIGGWFLLPAAYVLHRARPELLDRHLGRTSLTVLGCIVLAFVFPRAGHLFFYGHDDYLLFFPRAFENGNVFAFQIVLLLPFILEYSAGNELTDGRRRKRALTAALVAIGFLLMAYTSSAIGLALYVVLAVFTLVQERMHISPMVLFTAGLIAAAFALALVAVDVLYFETFTHSGSLEMRRLIYSNSVRVTGERIFSGHGAGSFASFWLNYTPAYIRGEMAYVDLVELCIRCKERDCLCHPMAHNLGLTLSVEFGILALIPWIAAIVFAVRRASNLTRAAYAVAPLVWSLLDDPLYFWPNIALFGVLVARAFPPRQE